VSDFDSLREDIAGAFAQFDHHAAAQRRFNDSVLTQNERLWTELAELRDEVHALSNRNQALTAFVTSNPAEVAAAIVNDANRATLKEVRNDD
jgi:hypothetical protein